VATVRTGRALAARPRADRSPRTPGRGAPGARAAPNGGSPLRPDRRWASAARRARAAVAQGRAPGPRPARRRL